MPSNNRGLAGSSTGIETGFRFRHYFTGLAKRHGNLTKIIVYCPDGTKRQIIGHTDIKIEPPYWSLLFLNGFYSGTPILSEPIGTYEFRELKTLVAKHVQRVRHSIVSGGPELRIQLEQAETFDDLLDIVYPTTSEK